MGAKKQRTRNNGRMRGNKTPEKLQQLASGESEEGKVGTTQSRRTMPTLSFLETLRSAARPPPTLPRCWLTWALRSWAKTCLVDFFSARRAWKRERISS